MHLLAEVIWFVVFENEPSFPNQQPALETEIVEDDVELEATCYKVLAVLVRVCVCVY